jgi:porin
VSRRAVAAMPAEWHRPCDGLTTGAALAMLACASAAAEEDRQPRTMLQAGYTADFLANVGGGLRRDSAYLHRIDLLAALERDGFADGQSITLVGNLIQTNDSTFSDAIVGDTQIVSNIDAPGGVRVLEAWLQYAFASRVSLKAGLYDLNSEFDYVHAGAFFINSSHGIGPDLSQSGENGPSIFPVTGLGARVEFPTGDRGLLRMAVIDGVPGAPDDPDRTSLHLSSDEGALIIAESNWSLSERLHAYGGMWIYTADFPVLDAASADERARAWGAYAAIDGRVNDELSAWLRLGHANPSVHRFDGYLGAGAVWHAEAVAPRLTLGVAVGWARASEAFRNASRLAAESAANREFNLELSARFELNDWLVLQPDLQWVRHPGARADIDDAWVVGLRVEAVRVLVDDPRW